MERLTRRSDNGTAVYATPNGEPVKWENNRHNVLQKLADYEDLEEQGLLLRFPCKVGDTIYYVADGKITEKHVNGFLYTNQLYIVTEEFNFNCPAAVIGHALFITREEAEAKLKEMECSYE